MKGLLKSASDILQSAPEKCKESVFEPPILLQNQANPQILLHFQAKVTDSLQKSGAQRARAAGSCCGRAPRAPPAWRETPSASSAFAQENPVPTRSGYRAEGTFAQLARAALAART